MGRYMLRHARYLITMNPKREIIKDGALVIDGNRIVDVGTTAAVAARHRDVTGDSDVDATGMIVLPGVINGHYHNNQQLARGLADNTFLPTFLHDRIYPFEDAMTPEDSYCSSLCACIEAIKTGTTTFADPGGYNMEQVARAVTDSGARALLARSMIDIHTKARPIPGKMRESTDKTLEAGEGFVKEHHGKANGRIRASFCLRTERMVSDELCRRTRQKADALGVMIQSHVSGNPDSVNRHKEAFRNLTPLVRYERDGLLGPNLLIVHANQLTPPEIELVRKYDVKVVTCPTAAFAGGYGGCMARDPELAAAGVTVCLGSDAAPESNFADMFRVMYALGAHRDAKLDPSLLPPELMLEMLITNGAKGLGWQDEIGSLETGKKADVILVDPSGPEWVPMHNPVSNLVLAGTGQSVHTVIIDGRIVMAGRKMTLIDEQAILREGQERAEAIARRAGVDHYGQPYWPVVE